MGDTNGEPRKREAQTRPPVPTAVAIADLRQACFHFADLYFHFAKVLVDALGPARGMALIEAAVRHRAAERGAAMRKSAIASGVPLTVEGWRQVTDIPFLAWDPALGRLTCPYAAAWLPRFEAEPWFRAVACRYCEVNDAAVTETFTGTTTQRITRNVLAGDATCEREYFPLKGGRDEA